MALRGTTPVAEAQRPKIFLFGEAGVGKTLSALQFPSPYLIDAERGATTEEYVHRIARSGGARFETTDIEEVLREVRALLSEAHPYRTLIVDPITTIYDELVDKCSRQVGEEWGRHVREAAKFMKQLRNLLVRLDMAVVVTAHGRVEYGDQMKVIGTTFDGWKKLDYVFDLVVELTRRGRGERWGKVRKTRYRQFPDGDEFRWSFDVFQERFGAEWTERPAAVAPLASAEQLEELESLLASAPIDRPALETKWLKVARVDTFSDMRFEDVGKCIEYLRKLTGKSAT